MTEPSSLLLALALMGGGAGDASAAAVPARSPASDVPVPGVVRAALPASQSDGAPVVRVFYDLLGSTGSDAGDRALRKQIEGLVDMAPGGVFRSAAAGLVASRLQALAGVGSAEVLPFAGTEPGSVVVVVRAMLVDPALPAAKTAPAWPVLSQGPGHLLRMQLSGSHGVFTDHNPWFASAPTFVGQSPIAKAPPGPGSTTWAESSLEYGLAGAMQLGDAPATAFAEVTGLASASTGNDLFRDDTRARNRLEKAYAGLAWVDRTGGRSLKLSSGRQNWQLYGGFLFSRFAAGANAGPHPGLYLNPRTAYQQANLLDARWGDWRMEAFEVDPSELDAFDSDSRYTGFNLRYQKPDQWEAGFTRFGVPESRSRIPLATGGSTPRQGLRTVSGRLGLTDVPGLPGVQVLAEYAEQDNVNVDWDAQAWYAQARYQFDGLAWKPNLTYRRARFSGDDPATPGQEAFDAQLSTGLDEWVQGVSFKKVVTNTNLDTHRLRLNFGPDARLNFTLDYFRLEAHRTLPGQPDHYGDELNFTVRWSVTPRLFFLGVAGVAWPGDALRERTAGDARPWNTVQASVFWGF